MIYCRELYRDIGEIFKFCESRQHSSTETVSYFMSKPKVSASCKTLTCEQYCKNASLVLLKHENAL